MVKNLPANTGDLGLIPGLARLPGETNGDPLLYSCLGNPTKVEISSQNQFYFSSYLLKIDNPVIVSDMVRKSQTEKI